MNAEFKLNGLKLETDRLILRPFTYSDLDDLYEYASVPGVGVMAGWPHHESKEESKKILDSFISEDQVFAICHKESGKVIGSLGVEKYGLEDRLSEFDGYLGREIGFVLSRDYWGRGIMTEAVSAIIDYLFNGLKLDFLTCGYYLFNEGSKRVQEKCGFKPYRRLKMETGLGTTEEGILNLLINKKKDVRLVFSHPETLIYEDKNATAAFPAMRKFDEICLDLRDEEWPFNGVNHDRYIVRAIVYDDEGYFYFVRADRDDDFGRAVVIETSGGGVEKGENLADAIRRELTEELGAEVEIITKIGVVSDYYNLIYRHNVNNYFLCRTISFGNRHLTEDEIEKWHLSTLKLKYDEAVKEYEGRRDSRLGRIIGNRELPILLRAKEIIDEMEKENDNQRIPEPCDEDG